MCLLFSFSRSQISHKYVCLYLFVLWEINQRMKLWIEKPNKEFEPKFYWQNNKSCPQIKSVFLHAQKVYICFLSANSTQMLTPFLHLLSSFPLVFSFSWPSFLFFTAWSLFRFPRLELPQRSPLPTSVSGLEARDTMEKHQKIKRAEPRSTTRVG